MTPDRNQLIIRSVAISADALLRLLGQSGQPAFQTLNQLKQDHTNTPKGEDISIPARYRRGGTVRVSPSFLRRPAVHALEGYPNEPEGGDTPFDVATQNFPPNWENWEPPWRGTGPPGGPWGGGGGPGGGGEPRDTSDVPRQRPPPNRPPPSFHNFPRGGPPSGGGAPRGGPTFRPQIPRGGSAFQGGGITDPTQQYGRQKVAEFHQNVLMPSASPQAYQPARGAMTGTQAMAPDAAFQEGTVTLPQARFTPPQHMWQPKATPESYRTPAERAHRLLPAEELREHRQHPVYRGEMVNAPPATSPTMSPPFSQPPSSGTTGMEATAPDETETYQYGGMSARQRQLAYQQLLSALQPQGYQRGGVQDLGPYGGNNPVEQQWIDYLSHQARRGGGFQEGGVSDTEREVREHGAQVVPRQRAQDVPLTGMRPQAPRPPEYLRNWDVPDPRAMAEPLDYSHVAQFYGSGGENTSDRDFYRRLTGMMPTGEPYYPAPRSGESSWSVGGRNYVKDPRTGNISSYPAQRLADDMVASAIYRMGIGDEKPPYTDYKTGERTSDRPDVQAYLNTLTPSQLAAYVSSENYDKGIIPGTPPPTAEEQLRQYPVMSQDEQDSFEKSLESYHDRQGFRGAGAGGDYQKGGVSNDDIETQKSREFFTKGADKLDLLRKAASEFYEKHEPQFNPGYGYPDFVTPPSDAPIKSLGYTRQPPVTVQGGGVIYPGVMLDAAGLPTLAGAQAPQQQASAQAGEPSKKKQAAPPPRQQGQQPQGPKKYEFGPADFFYSAPLMKKLMDAQTATQQQSQGYQKGGTIPKEFMRWLAGGGVIDKFGPDHHLMFALGQKYALSPKQTAQRLKDSANLMPP